MIYTTCDIYPATIASCNQRSPKQSSKQLRIQYISKRIAVTFEVGTRPASSSFPPDNPFPRWINLQSAAPICGTIFPWHESSRQRSRVYAFLRDSLLFETQPPRGRGGKRSQWTRGKQTKHSRILNQRALYYIHSEKAVKNLRSQRVSKKWRSNRNLVTLDDFLTNLEEMKVLHRQMYRVVHVTRKPEITF